MIGYDCYLLIMVETLAPDQPAGHGWIELGHAKLSTGGTGSGATIPACGQEMLGNMFPSSISNLRCLFMPGRNKPINRY